MRKFWRWVPAIAAVLLLGPSVSRADFIITIGDNDGFGFGAGAVPDNANLLNINLPEDRRSAAEAAATNGAQQTDFYSAVFTPLPNSFNAVFNLPQNMVSAIFEVDMGGFQATTFGQLGVSFNGVAKPNLFNFEDGAFATRVRQFALSATDIANANAAGQFIVTVTRDNSNDAIVFDYFRLDAVAVPAPSGIVLAGLGFLGFAGLKLRRSKKAVA